MICPKCGLNNHDSFTFCAACGTPIAAQPAPQPENTWQQPAPQPENAWQQPAPQPENAWQQPAPQPENAWQQSAPQPENAWQPQPENGWQQPDKSMPPPPKKSHKKLFITLGSIAAAIALILATWFGNLFGFRTWMTDFYISTFASPEVRLQYTYAKLAGKLGSAVSGVLETAADPDSVESTISGTYTITAGEGLKKLNIDPKMLNGLDLQELADTNIAMDYTVAVDGPAMALDVTLSESSNELIGAKICFDTEQQVMTLEIPQLDDEVYSVEFDEFMDQSALAYLSSSETAMPMLDQMLPDEDLINTLLVGCIEAAFDAMGDVDEESTTFEANGVEQSATCLSVTIDGETVVDMLLGMITYLQESSDLENYVLDIVDAAKSSMGGMGVDMSGELDTISSDMIIRELDNAMEELYDEVEDQRDEIERSLNGFELEWATYVDGNNEIVALDFDLQGMRLFLASAENGGKQGIELALYREDQRMGGLLGEGDRSGDLFTGDVWVEVNGQEYVNLALDSFDMATLAEGRINGTVTITSDKLKGFALELTAKQSTSDSEITLSALYSGVPMVTVVGTVDSSNSANVSVPEATDELEDFDPDDLEKLLDDSELIETLLEILPIKRAQIEEDSLLSSDDYYNDDYDYYDDYGSTFEDYADTFEDYSSAYGDYSYDYGADDYYDVPSYDYAY